MEQVSNPFQACNDIFFKPNRVFATIAEKDNWSWLPFVLVMLLSLLPTYLYFNFVDFNWYMETVMIASMGDVSPAEQDAVRNMMSQSTSLYGGMAAIFVVVLVMTAIIAIYLNLTTKSDEENLHGFTDWYGFMWWVSMPTIIGGFISVVLILLADDHQLNPLVAAPTTLAYILGAEIGDKWLSLLQAIRLEAFWSIYLMAVGISQWTKLAAKTAYKIAVAPYLIIWGIWAITIAL